MEERIGFPSEGIELEGLYRPGRAGKAVAITHPHPLYGGDMYSPVVEAISAAYGRLDFTTLRFNFRGVGKSTGSHDSGTGEQVDVAAAIDFLQKKGIEQIHLSGYSFGAWVNAMAMQKELPAQGLTMVAPPVAFMKFKPGIVLPKLSIIVAGSRDEFAPPDRIAVEKARWNPACRLDVIDGADHFFFGFLDNVAERLAEGIRLLYQ